MGLCIFETFECRCLLLLFVEWGMRGAGCKVTTNLLQTMKNYVRANERTTNDKRQEMCATSSAPRARSLQQRKQKQINKLPELTFNIRNITAWHGCEKAKLKWKAKHGMGHEMARIDRRWKKKQAKQNAECT